MITTLLFDFSRVLLFPKDEAYTGTLNSLHRKLAEENPNYSFFDYFRLNEELLEFLETIKTRFNLYIFTTDVVQKKPEVKARLDIIFTNVFAANDYGLSKKDPEAYTFIAKKIEKNPATILFIDDTKENLIAAEQTGLSTYQYETNNKLMEALKDIQEV